MSKDNVPEVLSITNFKIGAGLPATMIEMELIDQMREKRTFGEALPPTSDEGCFNFRRKLVVEVEVLD